MKTMRMPRLEHQPIADVLAQLHEGPLRNLELQMRVIRAGLEDSDVTHVTARYQDGSGRARRLPLIVKYLRGDTVREASVYQGLVAAHASELSPRLLSVIRLGTGDVVLYLEALRPITRWPWRDAGVAGQVLERLALLHTAAVSPDTRANLEAWDYETELQVSAETTIETLERYRRAPGLPSFGGRHQAARRVVLALPAIRRQLLALPSFGTVAIHGDMHPGNALVRRISGSMEPAFLDWSRARMGSPLEDVSSWLQSLGYWEPEARRRHDTLLVRYLRARGADERLLPEVRAAYWLAGASNALSGALRYHLSVALEPRTTSARQAAAIHSARDWLRVLRRADAFWN